MRLGYFPGCSLLGTAREYDESLRAISHKTGIELFEIPDWNCCGASAAHCINHDLSLALPARILALAEKEKLEEILVPCAACFNRLDVVRHELISDEKLRQRISGIIEMDFQGNIKVINIIEALSRIPSDGLKEQILKPFQYTVACYYGCLLVRPPKIVNFDRAEDPQIMDDVMKKIGADTIDWAYKVECCGAGFSVSRTDIVAKLSGKIIKDAVQRGAEAIIVACPMCHSNLDMRRSEIERLEGRKYSIPVLYITQAIGLALGISNKKLGLHRHIVPVKLPLKVKTVVEKEFVPTAKAEEE
ncbi:heterodisulfide reductase subunit B [bacterium SM23_31]|nr:MAG: heterodisulfide reductase subunit B [bacterium SM23_31]